MRFVQIAVLVLSAGFMSSAFATFGFTGNKPVQVDSTGYLISGIAYAIDAKPYKVFAQAADLTQKFQDSLCVQFQFKKARNLETFYANGNPMPTVIIDENLKVLQVSEQLAITSNAYLGISEAICEY